jgi:hypothetical protein
VRASRSTFTTTVPGTVGVVLEATSTVATATPESNSANNSDVDNQAGGEQLTPLFSDPGVQVNPIPSGSPGTTVTTTVTLSNNGSTTVTFTPVVVVNGVSDDPDGGDAGARARARRARRSAVPLTTTGATVTANVTAPSVPDSNPANNTSTQLAGAQFADVTTEVTCRRRRGRFGGHGDGDLHQQRGGGPRPPAAVTNSASGGTATTASATVGTVTLSNGQVQTYTLGDLAPGASVTHLHHHGAGHRGCGAGGDQHGGHGHAGVQHRQQPATWTTRPVVKPPRRCSATRVCKSTRSPTARLWQHGDDDGDPVQQRQHDGDLHPGGGGQRRDDHRWRAVTLARGRAEQRADHACR